MGEVPSECEAERVALNYSDVFNGGGGVTIEHIVIHSKRKALIKFGCLNFISASFVSKLYSISKSAVT